uniref:RNA helicase n=1 Tax=Panagrellus redivivus TaxID=6233 RepID=A0A7E4ZYT6_PANRE
MVKSIRYQRHQRVLPYAGRVSKRQYEPKDVQRQTNAITHQFLFEHHRALLDGLQFPTKDIALAAAKFESFVALEKLSNELNTPIQERLIASDVRFYNGYRIVSKKKADYAERAKVEATITLALGPDSNFRLAKEREAIILVKAENEDSQNPLFGRQINGFITKRDGWRLTVRVLCKLEDLDDFKHSHLQLYVDVNTMAQKLQLDAIANVRRKRFLQQKLAYDVTPPVQRTVVSPRCSRSRSPSVICLDDEDDLQTSKFASSGESVICLDDYPVPPPKFSASRKPSTGLNAEQQMAIDEMIRDDTDSMFMLFGPPGTGKTFTLIKAIVELVRTGGRVLICTPSNKAADVIACGILNEGINSLHRHVSRTLDPMMVPAELRSHAGIHMNGQQALFTAEDAINLDEYDVVVTTLGSTPALRKSMTTARREFSHIVVDEAGQAAEMEVWMPLAFFAAESTRLIVAGDPMQLGPVAPAHLLDDPVYGYKTSILSRLYQNEAFRSDSQNMVQLTKNYRSHESIVNIVSGLFYNNSLQFTRPAGHDSLHHWPDLPQDKFPIVFESVAGYVRTDNNGSSWNKAEAEGVAFYVDSLLRSRLVQAHEIGVVSPYTAQTQYIRHLLGPSSEVTVDTVEKFQGSERRVIIMTAVRNGDALGFMDDRQRLNTALSRAQQMLIVIGHGPSLEVSPDWFKFIQYCKQNNAYIGSD